VLQQESSSADATQEWAIYLAPSTIPGDGLGMFAGNKEYRTGDVVTDSDVMIPTFELEGHNNDNDQTGFTYVWDQYHWNANMFDGMEQEVNNIYISYIISGGTGAAINCRMNLLNVDDEEISRGLSTLMKLKWCKR
jgi:hypothetical protein